MFIELELSQENLTGLAAIDARRQLGLAHMDSLTLSSSRFDSGSHCPRLEIDEAFARRWFGPTQTESHVVVPRHLLQPGDLRPATESGYRVTFALLGPERICDLYESTRIAGLREENQRLTDLVDRLREELSQKARESTDEACEVE